MNVVQKQIFKGQVGKLQTELGLGGNQSSPLDGFFDNNEPTPSRSEETFASDEAVDLHAALPANYPPLLHVVYIDRSILSANAAPAVAASCAVFYASLAGSATNIAVSMFVLVVSRPGAVVAFIISVLAGLAVSILSLLVYETGFRGAYRSQPSTQLYYTIAAIASAVVFSVYANAGVAFFHGWSRLGNAAGNQKVAYQVLTGLEAIIWTLSVGLAFATAYRYHCFRASHAKGLSIAARNSILAARHTPAPRAPAASSASALGGRAHDGGPDGAAAAGKRAKLDAIRDKYRSNQSPDVCV
jgi:hypothetical protein